MIEAKRIETGRVLVVDDEPQIHRFLKPALEAAGYVVLRADRGVEALRLAVIVKLREFSEVPVIVLSARDQEAQKIAAFDAGANDYVEKPFGLGELLARIRNAFRLIATGQGVPTEVIAFDGLRIDEVARSVRLDGEEIHFTKTEFRILAALVRHRGKLVTHDDILRAGWGGVHDSDRTYIRIYIRNIRQKLGTFADNHIRTRQGLGYIVE
ncbi:MAG: DNA-binding response regulator [Acidiphilium sp. 37-67-22]|nr:MAG: DNA-binding response regulator [Acidiphilium sp. 37-67-22]